MAIGRLSRRRPLDDEMSLQITSMADIFMILLVFLLKSYTAGGMNLSPAKGLLLPDAQAAPVAFEALKLEITETAISIEGQPAVALTAFRLDPATAGPNGTSRPLALALEKERKRQVLIAQSNSDVKVDPRIIVSADRRVPYETVKAVLASAAIHGYTDFKLAVVRGD